MQEFHISILHWIGFALFLALMLSLDLGVFRKKQHIVKFKEAVIWVCVWVTLAVLFNLVILYFLGSLKALEFFTGYLLEYSLSVDNIFVFILLFTYFEVPNQYQHKVLFWGIIGAIIMRGILIFAGTTLILKFHWIIYIFGAFLVFTGIKMALQKEGGIKPEKNPLVKLFKKFFPVSSVYHNDRFFTIINKKKFATPLFIVLLIVETTDLIFAFDSIPAILAITQDTFIVFTSNAFAILGLRSLYFLLSGIMKKFHYLKFGLSIILVYIGVKMLISEVYKIHIGISLIIITVVLTISIISSLYKKK